MNFLVSQSQLYSCDIMQDDLVIQILSFLDSILHLTAGILLLIKIPLPFQWNPYHHALISASFPLFLSYPAATLTSVISKYCVPWLAS